MEEVDKCGFVTGVDNEEWKGRMELSMAIRSAIQNLNDLLKLCPSFSIFLHLNTFGEKHRIDYKTKVEDFITCDVFGVGADPYPMM